MNPRGALAQGNALDSVDQHYYVHIHGHSRNPSPNLDHAPQQHDDQLKYDDTRMESYQLVDQQVLLLDGVYHCHANLHGSPHNTGYDANQVRSDGLPRGTRR